MFLLGYWVLSNRQAFHNEPDEFMTWTTNLPVPHHYLIGPLLNPIRTGNFEDIYPSHVLLVIGIIWFIIVLLPFNPLRKDTFNCFKHGIKAYECAEEETHSYKEYFTCLSPMQRQKWIATELYQRKVLGIRTLEDNALERLVQTVYLMNAANL